MNTRRRRTKSGSKEDNKENFNAGYGIPLTNSGKTFTETSQNYNQVIVDPIDMSCRDRTGEFLSAVKSLQSSQVRSFIRLTILFQIENIFENNFKFEDNHP